jgi:hypothetical protein
LQFISFWFIEIVAVKRILRGIQGGALNTALPGGAGFKGAEFLIRVFPHRNKWTPDDPLAFIGDCPLFAPGTLDEPVRISVTFTWHKQRAEEIAQSWRARGYQDVQIGGPAYGDPGGEFVPGRFMKAGCTITSRGCPKKCGWCVVPRREGQVRELKINPGWIIQDNNLLACSDTHIRAVFDMLREQGRAAYFNGGLDKHFLKDWHRDLFDSIKLGELWFACDTSTDIPWLERTAKILDGIPLRKKRCYTMIGYEGESLSDAERRVERVFELGFMPFCQLYQSDQTIIYPEEWRKVSRKWARPAAYMGKAA